MCVPMYVNGSAVFLCDGRVCVVHPVFSALSSRLVM